MGALGVLAAVALLVGGVQTTMVMPEPERLANEESKEPVVEVQAVSADSTQTVSFLDF
ncbi:hypothetical protein [Thiocapsa roseopersicina]|uniref:Uncharacterized protein n=1 Tax=Thiocapsa roseopersicina TaxID=1058 RepID=A0A1H2QYK5_THIRO|nr:hypothetical protein [Thiocapsa roseopersicina]SDW12175.1 hypothetical protein SAMN05421783_101469 [Thiocapsa roseopersicina]